MSNHQPTPFSVVDMKEVKLADYFPDEKVRYIENPEKRVVHTLNNSFFDSIIHAYLYRIHLFLHPDDVWLAILQYIKIYVPDDDNKIIFKDTSELMNYVRKRNPITIDQPNYRFSTSDDVSTFVSNACSSFLIPTENNFSLTRTNGIPSITLGGVSGDWEDILNKLKQVQQTYQSLELWVDIVTNVINEFIKVFKGETNEFFWRNMIVCFKKTNKRLYGWINVFIPNTDMIPVGRSVIKCRSVELVSGFIGMNLCLDTLTISPNLSYYVRERDRKITKEDKDKSICCSLQ